MELILPLKVTGQIDLLVPDQSQAKTGLVLGNASNSKVVVTILLEGKPSIHRKED